MSAQGRDESESRSPEPAPSARHRPKVTRACDQCRRNKTRCTGSLPCVNCVKSKATCSYDIPYTRGKAPAPKPLSQHGQNKRVEKSSSVRTPSLRNQSRAAHSRNVDEDYEINEGPSTSVEEILGEIDNIGIREPETCNHHLYDMGTQHQQSSEAFQSRTSNSISWNSPPFSQFSPVAYTETSMFSYGDAPFPKYSNSFFVLPPLEKAQKMAATYFHRTSGTYQILNHGLVDRAMKEMYNNGIIQTDASLNASRALVLMVFAVSQDHEAPERNDEKIELGYRYFNLAENLLQSATGPPTHTAISAYLLQCFFLLSHSRINQAYYLLGIAISLVYSAGINRKTIEMDQMTVECSKRALWGAYTLDKLFATALGRTVRLKDQDIDQTLLSSSQFPLPDAFDFQYKLARITALIHTTSYALSFPTPPSLVSWTRTIHKDLLSWHETLATQRASLSSRHNTILELSYLGNIILLHLPFLMNNMESDEQVRWDIEHTINAATEICSIINSLAENRQAISWLERYCAYNASLVLYIFVLTHHSTLPPQTAQSHLSLATRCHRQIQIQTQIQLPIAHQHPSSFSSRCNKVLDEAKAEVQARMQARQHQESATHHASSHFAGEWGDMEFDQGAPGGGVLSALLSLVGGVRVREGGGLGDIVGMGIGEKGNGSIVERIRRGGWTGLLGY